MTPGEVTRMKIEPLPFDVTALHVVTDFTDEWLNRSAVASSRRPAILLAGRGISLDMPPISGRSLTTPEERLRSG